MSKKSGGSSSPVELRGKEIFEIKPVILGGDPNDEKNKVVLSRDQHKEAVRYWNRVIRDLRTKSSGEIE